MRSHKYRFTYDKFVKLKKWDPYKGYRYGRRYSRMLPSGYYENQVWGALHKAWVGYMIAINKLEFNKDLLCSSNTKITKRIRLGSFRF